MSELGRNLSMFIDIKISLAMGKEDAIEVDFLERGTVIDTLLFEGEEGINWCAEWIGLIGELFDREIGLIPRRGRPRLAA